MRLILRRFAPVFSPPPVFIAGSRCFACLVLPGTGALVAGAVDRVFRRVDEPAPEDDGAGGGSGTFWRFLFVPVAGLSTSAPLLGWVPGSVDGVGGRGVVSTGVVRDNCSLAGGVSARSGCVSAGSGFAGGIQGAVAVPSGPTTTYCMGSSCADGSLTITDQIS